MDGVRNLLQLALVLGSLTIGRPAVAARSDAAWLPPAAGAPDDETAPAREDEQASGQDGASPAAAGTLSANGPVRLDGGRSAWGPPVERREPAREPDAAMPERDDADEASGPAPGEDSGVSNTQADTAPIDLAARSTSESKPLGRDAGLLRLGTNPASDDGDAAAVAEGFLPAGMTEVLRIGGALAVVVGLLLLFAILTRRLSGTMRAGRPAGVLEVLARYPVGRGQHLMLLKLDRRVLLVHQSGSNMATLADLREPGEVASLLSRIEASSRETMGGRFQALLERAGGRLADGTVVESGGDVETIDLTRGASTRRRLLP